MILLTPPNRHLLPPHLNPRLNISHQIPFKNHLNLKPQCQNRLKKTRHNRTTQMRLRHHPDSPARSKEPRHRAREALMLRLLPEAICHDDAGKGALVFLGEGGGEHAPFVRLDRDLRGGWVWEIGGHVGGDWA